MYKNRLRMLLIGVVIAMIVLTWRMFQLQVLQGHSFREAAIDLLDSTHRLATVRGHITDRNGLFLAMNEVNYSFCLDYRFLTNDPDWVRKQKDLIKTTRNVNDADAADIYQTREDNTLRIAEHLAAQYGVNLADAEQKIVRRVQAIRQQIGGPAREEREMRPLIGGMRRPIYIDLDKTIGAEIRPSLIRRYPYGQTACHIIGMVGQVSPEELERMDVPSDSLVGKRGVELMCEEMLRGKQGYQTTDRMGEKVVVLEDVPPVPGQDIHLTIDINLQKDIEQLFTAMAKGRNGAAVVISVRTGEVLAMASVPTYDLNTFNADFSMLVADDVDLPLLHRAVTRYYPPGSIAKPVTALAGLTDGVISPDTIFTCQGYLHSPSAFRCWIYGQGGSHGPLDLVGALKNSCNVYFYNVGERLGIDREREWFHRFGFGLLSGTGLPEEKPGSVASGPQPQGPGTARQLAIGQGPFDATPLQSANAIATIARGGVFLSPIIALEGGPTQTRRDLNIPARYIQAVQQGMYEVCNSPGGTAYKPFHLGSPGDVDFRPLDTIVCGKTGTSQTAPQRVDSNQNGRIDGDDEIIRRGDMAWFDGFAPREQPQVAVAVVVEYVTDGGGSTYAAPIGREIIRLCKQYGYIR